MNLIAGDEKLGGLEDSISGGYGVKGKRTVVGLSVVVNSKKYELELG